MTRTLALAACTLLVGCADQKERTLGAAFEGIPVPIAATRHPNTDAPVVLHGTMTEKCPVAGCWFILRDASGTIKVDTKDAGFVVVQVPLNTSLLVAGRVVTNGSERTFEATGVRY